MDYGNRAKRTRKGLLGAALAIALLSPLAAHAQSTPGVNPGSACIPGPGDQPETDINGGVPLANNLPPNFFQGFWCGARKIGQHALYNRGSFGDLQIVVDDRGACAYASMRDPSDLNLPTTGTVVLDVSVPSHPQDVRVLRTPAMLRSYSGFEAPISIETGRPGNFMIAGFKDFGPNGTNPIDIYDLTGPDCLKTELLSSTDAVPGQPFAGHHDGWVSGDGKTWYGIPFGGPDIRVDPTRIDIHIHDISDPRNPKTVLLWNRLQLPPDIYAATNATRNFHDVTANPDGSRVYMALYGAGSCANGLLIMDATEIRDQVPNPKLKYIRWLSWCEQQIDADFGDGSSASAHATEYMIHESGKEFVLSTDEGGALGGGTNGANAQHTYSRLIDISDEKNPVVVATMTPDFNRSWNNARNIANGITGGMLHYLNFDNRFHARLAIYAASNEGMRIYDFRDPYSPKQIAYYHKENHDASKSEPANLYPNYTTGSTGDTNDTDFSRPDPRYDGENCYWYTGWNQGGLVSIELTNPEYNACMRKTVKGQGSFIGRTGKKVQFSVNAKRGDGGLGALAGTVTLTDNANKANVYIDKLTLLGGVRDDCKPVTARGTAVQVEGTGTYNGRAASFRVCAQESRDEGSVAQRHGERFFLSCTSGCAYETGGELTSGNISVKRRQDDLGI